MTEEFRRMPSLFDMIRLYVIHPEKIMMLKMHIQMLRNGKWPFSVSRALEQHIVEFRLCPHGLCLLQRVGSRRFTFSSSRSVTVHKAGQKYGLLEPPSTQRERSVIPAMHATLRRSS